MRNTTKIIKIIAISLAIFTLLIFVEPNIRGHYGGPMSIDGLPISNTNVAGAWIPDFLWAGKAWKLEIQSSIDLKLSLDDKDYIIPKGSHIIYSNHDRTNTGQFGNQEFWGYPKKTKIHPLDKNPG